VSRAHRLAVLTAAATCVLIVFGGLVTNTGAALAVPDWPTTFGHNMFLFPWSQMVGGVFYEHSHRLLGSLVGLLTLALAAVLWPRGGRLRALGIAAVVAVIAQGVIGGLRVVLLTDGLAMVHGPLAQAFFALIVAIALITSERMGRPVAALDGATRGLTLAARISPPARRWATGNASMVSCPPGIQTAENRARYAPTPSTSCTAKRISSVRAAGLMTASPVRRSRAVTTGTSANTASAPIRCRSIRPAWVRSAPKTIWR